MSTAPLDPTVDLTVDATVDAVVDTTVGARYGALATGPDRSPAPVRRPILAAVAVLVASGAVAIGTAGVMDVLAPGADGRTAALVGLGVLTVLAAVLVAALRHRPGMALDALGFTHPRAWRRPWLLAVPSVLALAALAGGVRAPDSSAALVVLLVGYTVTGVTEETLWRGTVLQLLRPLGDRRAVLLGSLLFGLAHLTNVVFRGNPALVGAQAFGAACFGVGYAAIRLRTGALWPLIATHLLTDLVPHVGRLPALAVFVAQDVVLLLVGLALLFGGRLMAVRPRGAGAPQSGSRPLS